MIHLLDLPVEIQSLIVNELDITDLKEACLVSKKLNLIIIPILYRTIRLKPDPFHGIELHQKDSLFNVERPHPHLKHVKNLQVIHPRAGKGLSSMSLFYIESQLQSTLRRAKLRSLSLVSGLGLTPEVVLITQYENLRALHLDVPQSIPGQEVFAYLGTSQHALRTLSLRILSDWLMVDIAALNGFLSQLENLHSLDLKFWESRYRPVVRPRLLTQGLKLIDTIFGMKSLRELCLLGNEIPFGYWAEANPRKRVGEGLTLFKSESIDRGDYDGEICDKDDKFWFQNFDPKNLKCFHFCLGIIYMTDSTPEQSPRYVARNNKLQLLLASCERVEELRLCNLPQMNEFNPADHCLFRVKHTLRRLRICSNDWYGMDFLDEYVTEETYAERQKGIIAELTALQILELTLQWLKWNISSPSLQLVHILREPEFDPENGDSSFEDESSEVDTALLLPPREFFLEIKAQEFAEVTQEKMLPSLKIVMFSKLNFFREHSHSRRFEGKQENYEDYPPLAYLVEMEGENDLPYGIAEPIRFKEIEKEYPWLYDGTWEGKIWDESQGYRLL